MVHSLCIFLIDTCRHADAWESDCCLAKIRTVILKLWH